MTKTFLHFSQVTAGVVTFFAAPILVGSIVFRVVDKGNEYLNFLACQESARLDQVVRSCK